MAVTTNSYDFLAAPSQSGDLGTLAHYRVIDELGRGGMGYVFRAEDVKLKRRVALKVMNQKIAAAANSRSRFLSEARAMAAVHHDNVATIFEVGESSGTPFMAMEMLKGCTLETFNKGTTRLGFEKIIDYATQIARGLAAAHANGIVHRDIKPANIWIEEGNNRIKILDFGLALASSQMDQLAGRGAVIGTPGYLSPEQARSDPLDDRSDLYSLGVVLYELCTGQWPIRRTTVSEQLISILAHRPRPIQEINPDTPQPLCDLVLRLLRKEPRTRPSSAKFLEQELRRVEKECHAKSEVAQAINKLQMGLSEVVNKQSSEIAYDAVEEVPVAMPDNLPDPLAALPAPVTMMPPARPAVKKPPPAPAWKTYWPIAAIAGVILLAIPLIALAIFKSGGREVASTAPVTSASANQNSSNTNTNGQSNQQPQSTTKAQSQTKPNKNGQATSAQKPGGPNKTAQNPAGQNKGGQNKAGPNKTGQAQNKSAAAVKPKQTPRDSSPKTPGPKTPGSAPKPESSNVKMTGASLAATTKPSSPAPPPPTQPPSPAPAQAETTWTTISASEGNGADAMVKKGTTEKLGDKLNIAIGMRKGIETHHSYVRFDLAGIENIKRHVKSAELTLTVVGRGGSPVGANVRVTGLPEVPWPEEFIIWRNSFSQSGLDEYRLLIDAAVTDQNAVQQGGRYLIRLSSPELSQFIAASSSDTVTLVLSGSAPPSKGNVLAFVSREDPSSGPKLLIETPKNPPPNDEKKKR